MRIEILFILMVLSWFSILVFCPISAAGRRRALGGGFLVVGSRDSADVGCLWCGYEVLWTLRTTPVSCGRRCPKRCQGCLRLVRAPPVFTDKSEAWNAVQTVSTQREAKDRSRAASEEPF